VSGLEFVSPALAQRENGFEPVQRSPLERALRDAPSEVRDLSLRVPEDAQHALREQGHAAETTSGLAGIQVTGERLLRRLTDLDLDALPATGLVAHVRATVLRDGDEFRIFFPQEYADHVAEVVLDAIAGLA
jgi:hypothetical protein